MILASTHQIHFTLCTAPRLKKGSLQSKTINIKIIIDSKNGIKINKTDSFNN